VNQAFFSLGLLASVAAQDANLPATEPVIVRGSEITAAEFTSASAAVGADNVLVESLSRRAANFLINEAGASSFNDVYSLRALREHAQFQQASGRALRR